MDKLKTLLNNPQFTKYQNLIIAGFSIIVCVLLIAFLIFPQLVNLTNTNREVAQKKEKNRLLSQKISDLEFLNTEDYKNNLNASLAVLPDDKEIPGVIGQVLSMLSSSGLALDALTFTTQGDQSATLSSYTVKLSVVGETASLRMFFDKVNKSPRLMKVSDIEVSNIGILNRAQSTIELMVYFQPLPTTIGSIEQPISLLSDKEQEVLQKVNQLGLNNVSQSTDSSSVSPVGKSDPFE